MKLLSTEVIVTGLIILGVAILWWATIIEGKKLLNANESEPVVYAFVIDAASQEPETYAVS